jgi:hypothetical protein
MVCLEIESDRHTFNDGRQGERPVHSNSKRSVKSATRPKHSNPDAGQKSSITDRVYEEVKLMAMTYRFRPGERINEVLLAEQLQVSRTPLREALNRLSS